MLGKSKCQKCFDFFFVTLPTPSSLFPTVKSIKMKKVTQLLLVALLLSFVQTLAAQTDVNILTYNILNYPNANNDPLDGNDARAGYFRQIVEDANADLIIVQELLDSTGATLLVNELNTNGTLGKTYAISGGYDIYDKYMLFYNVDLFNFISVVDVPRINSAVAPAGNTVLAPRGNSHYTLSYPANPTCVEQEVLLHVFDMHLKAGNDPAFNNEIADQDRRQLQALDLLDYLTANLTTSDNIVLGGDYNLYGDFEVAYQTITMNTTNPFTDPGGSWIRNDPAYLSLFTQSSRATGVAYNNGGIWGGLDDRFDFWFYNDAILNNTDRVTYNPNTYQPYGTTNVPWNGGATDGTHPLKLEIELMSDHFPLLMQLQINSPTSLCPSSCNAIESLPGPIPSGLYSAINTIDATSGILDTGSNVTLHAGDCVLLGVGFEVPVGAELTVENIACQ